MMMMMIMIKIRITGEEDEDNKHENGNNVMTVKRMESLSPDFLKKISEITLCFNYECQWLPWPT